MNHLHCFNQFVLERSPLRLRKGTKVINLTPKQLDALALIVDARGATVPKDEFFTKVWHATFVEDGNLTQTIFQLRKALGRLPDGGEIIETIPRQGYRLAPAALHRSEIDWTGAPSMARERHQARPELPREPEAPQLKEADFVSPVQGFRVQRSHIAMVTLIFVSAAMLTVVLIRASNARPLVMGSTNVTSNGIDRSISEPLLIEGQNLFVNESIANRSYVAEYTSDGHLLTRLRPPMPGGRAIGKYENSSFIFAVPSNPSGRLTMMLPSGETRPMEGGLVGQTAALSPDGRTLVIARDKQLLLANPDGTNVRVLATLSFQPSWPSWSPDNEHIRFTMRQGENRQTLWDVDKKTAVINQILVGSPHEHEVCCGSWSPSGKYFVYVVDEKYRSSLWVRNETTGLDLFPKGHEWELVSGTVNFWRSPAISSDGHRVYTIGQDVREGLVQLSPATGSTSKVVFEGLSADSIAYSNDGKWIAYSLLPEGTLWRSRLDGSDKVQLTANGTLARFPQWSPDDSHLIFLATTPGETWQVHEVSADGSTELTLAKDLGNVGVATFSSDGTKIAYGRSRDIGIESDKNSSIAIMDLETGEVRKLDGSEGLWNARWSPDGRYIVAATADRRKLMLFDFKMKHWSQLADEAEVDDIAWSRDSRKVLFDANSGTKKAVYVVPIAGGRIETYPESSGYQSTDLLAQHLCVTPTNEILALRQTGTTEVYRLDVNLP